MPSALAVLFTINAGSAPIKLGTVGVVKETSPSPQINIDVYPVTHFRPNPINEFWYVVFREHTSARVETLVPERREAVTV